MVRLFKKRFKGVAVLEAAMTLPIILNILFFALEFIRVELAQIAVDAIARRCTMELMDSDERVSKADRMANFDKIIAGLKPVGVPLKNIRYYIRLYPSLHNPDPSDPNDLSKYDKNNPGMMDVYPYGGETIGWAGSDFDNPNDVTPNAAAKSNHYGLSSDHPLMRGYYNTTICNGDAFGEVGDDQREGCLTMGLDEIEKSLNIEDKLKDIRGYAFVFTVAIKFPFASAFTAKLFGGGSNTNQEGVYIVWARGSGIVNKVAT